jgi:hypothetical protein
MSRQELSDEEIKADILYRLIRKHRWGATYFPADTLINWLSKQVKKNGKRVRKCIEDLTKDGYILLHKKGKTISLNPFKKKEIIEYIRAVSKAYSLNPY